MVSLQVTFPSLPTTSTPLLWKLFFLGASCSLSSGLRDTRSPKQRFLAVVVRQRSRDWGRESGLRRRDSLVRGTAARETQEGSCSCWRRACRERQRGIQLVLSARQMGDGKAMESFEEESMEEKIGATDSD